MDDIFVGPKKYLIDELYQWEGATELKNIQRGTITRNNKSILILNTSTVNHPRCGGYGVHQIQFSDIIPVLKQL